MHTRFDLPPEVMPDERVVRPSGTDAAVEDCAHEGTEVTPGVWLRGDGKMFTLLDSPPAGLEDVAMLFADLGPPDEEDKEDEPNEPNAWRTRPVFTEQSRQQDRPMAQRIKFDIEQVSQQDREMAQQIHRRRTAVYRALTGPRFRVMRSGISLALPITEMSRVEMADCAGVTAAMMEAEMERRDLLRC